MKSSLLKYVDSKSLVQICATPEPLNQGGCFMLVRGKSRLF